MKEISLFIILLVNSFISLGNTGAKDISVLQQRLNDVNVPLAETTKIFNDLAQHYAGSLPDSALYYLDKSIALAEDNGFLFEHVRGLNLHGIILKDRGKYIEALNILNKALTINEQLNDVAKETDILYNISSVHYEQGDNQTALNYILQVLEADRKAKNSEGLGYTHFRIFEIYRKLDQDEYAKEHLDKSLSYRLQKKNFEELGHVYNGYFMYHFDRKEYAEALKYTEKAYDNFKKVAYKLGLVNHFHNLALIKYYQKNNKEAIKYYQKEANLGIKYGFPQKTASAYHGIGAIYLRLNNPASALKYLNQAQEVYEKIDVPKGKLAYAKHSAYLQMKDYNSALISFKEHVEYTSAQKEINHQEQLNRLALQLQTTEKENENDLLKANQQIAEQQITKGRKTSLFLTIIILLLGIVLFYRYRIYKHKKGYAKKLEREVQIKTKELQDSKQNLKNAHDELKFFYATIAHDLNQTVLLSQIQIEELGKYVDTSRQDLVIESKKNLISLNQQFKTILDFFKSEDKALVTKNINTNQLLKDIIFNFSMTKELKELQIDYGNLPDITGDIYLIRQVFSNLIANAVKYTAKVHNPKLVILSKIENGEVCIYFNDNGTGIPQEFHQEIFQPFHSKSSKNSKNLGIGLFIAKRIIERHGGKITVVSGDARNTSFKLQFPI